MASFTSQNTEYNYQNKRIDAVQDLEFAIRFIADDLRSALVKEPVGTADPNPAENAAFAGTAATTSLTFWGWAPGELGVDATTKRAQRKYVWNSANKSLRYDRMVNTKNSAGATIATGDDTGTASGEILPNVTFFKVFKDNVDIASRASFSNIPAPLQPLTINDSAGTGVSAPGYTILVEIEVLAGYKKGVFQDARGNATTTKRVWRYVQVHPQTTAN
ncbi:MAG: hypothetical protein ACE5F3_01065 [Mariprofundaceae bacterium]